MKSPGNPKIPQARNLAELNCHNGDAAAVLKPSA